ncbi:MAG: Hsp70 family protein [Anaerolineae bacterium]|nr:Hsp70 family protein [Anaerolineae bacterium]
MHIGLDFGTTHCGAAVYDGERVRVLPLDPASRDPTVIRSTLYITRDHEITIGQEAIDTYYRQNTGRPSRMIRQYVGEIEITTGEIGSVKGYPVGPSTFVRDVYVMVDELTPGQLLRSLKSALSGSYEGTTIFDRYYELEELIAIYMRELRSRIEAQLGETVDGVMIGRPVHFVGGGQQRDDQRAERRLYRAARQAGFVDISFELEPVAAALHYEQMVKKPQNIAVFDFGGGTLDITVMRIGRTGQRQVYATGGLGIAGDDFDRRIIEGVLLDHFGRGSTWSQEGIPFPDHYTDALVNWQTLSDLNQPETLRFLRQAQHTSSHPDQLKALESLLANNYAIRMIDQVEKAKIVLSADRFAVIELAGEDLDIWQPIARSQFETLIAQEMHGIEACLLDTVARSGLGVGEIDAVVRTGGSAEVPCVIQMMERIFGPERVVLSDVFNSVTAGLAIRASMEAI